MRDKTLIAYIQIRHKMSVKAITSNSVTGDFECASENKTHLLLGIEFGIVSNILENDRTVRDTDIKEGRTYQITLNAKISPDIAVHYLSETDTNFGSHFSKRCIVPKNLYIHSIEKEGPGSLKIFQENLLYAHELYTLLDNIFSYKNEEVTYTEFFLFSTQPLTIKTIYQRSTANFIKEVKELISLVKTDLKREIYKPLLRIEIINFLRLSPENDRFKILIENFNVIYLNFTNSLTIYVSQFSFDTFKDNFQKEKEKYFVGVREIVNKAYSQIITIPISIGAVAFATNKLTEKDSLIINLVYGSFLLYVVYYLIIQFVYLLDLIELKKEFTEDFDIIQSKSGLQKDVLQKKFKQIRNKFMISISISIFLMIMVGILGVFVCAFIIGIKQKIG